MTYRDFGLLVIKACLCPEFVQLDYLVILQEQLDRGIDDC